MNANQLNYICVQEKRNSVKMNYLILQKHGALNKAIYNAAHQNIHKLFLNIV